jgi:ABC-type Fe3+-hydroxamate transport system substrate-binding protein
MLNGFRSLLLYMPVYTDQTGRIADIPSSPRRIISLVPSQTELLYDLGLREEVAGITKFCIHPEEWFKNKPRIGGTKQLKMDIIHSLQPDLIIANKEENGKEQVDELAKHYPTWTSDVITIEDAYGMIEQLGTIVGKKMEARILVDQVKDQFLQLKTQDAKLKTAYLVWNDPYMTVGGDTFIHSMMEMAGFENVYAGQTRYPELTIDQLRSGENELLLLSSEPFPFKQKHIDELKMQGVKAKIMLVDGEMFSWYGSRMKYAADYFQDLLAEIKDKN